MISEPRVLIVDESCESREVLCALVQRNGAVALESSRVELAAELVCRHQPHVIVYDAESDHSDSREATRQLAETARSCDTPVIMLGSVRRRDPGMPSGQFVSKPYHYGPLLRKIEELLAPAG